ncbi:MAG: right-handed parallel beta-helix repeat-containing protein [bacterium]|nr:right-handed parallel beta-helix repeat-containing protein [bacterium]
MEHANNHKRIFFGVAVLVSVVGLALLQFLPTSENNIEAAEPSLPLNADLQGDGVADDTQALQAMIDDQRGDVQLPKGVYRITKPLVIDLDTTGLTSIHGNGVAVIEMEGAGPAIKIIGTHMRSADPRGFEDRVWKHQRMPLIDGLAIVGAHEEADGIEATGTMQLTLTRLHIRKCRHGVHLVKNNRNVIISDCQIYENSGAGVYYNDVNLHQSNITGSHISYCGAGGVVTRAGAVRNLHITGCDLESNMSPDLPPTANVLIDCRGSSAGTAEVAITGCTIQHNREAAGSANVRIIGNSDPTEKLARIREGHITITGNIFSDVRCNVHLKECRGVTMTGNTFWMGFDHNLLAESCSNLVIGPNAFDRNPRYAYGVATTSKNSLVFRDCEDSTLTGLHISGVHDSPAGLVIDSCRRMNISNCTILDCDNVGLMLKNLSHSRVSGCLIRDDREGAVSLPMSVEGSVGNKIDE